MAVASSTQIYQNAVPGTVLVVAQEKEAIGAGKCLKKTSRNDMINLFGRASFPVDTIWSQSEKLVM